MTWKHDRTHLSIAFTPEALIPAPSTLPVLIDLLGNGGEEGTSERASANFDHFWRPQSFSEIILYSLKGLQYLTLSLRDWRDSNPRPTA